jgi:hypothetical protein
MRVAVRALQRYQRLVFSVALRMLGGRAEAGYIDVHSYGESGKQE